MPTEYKHLTEEQKALATAATRELWRRLEDSIQAMFRSEGFADVLCHYTDFKGLRGILESDSIWASNCRTMNDGSEFEFGIAMLRKHIADGLVGTETLKTVLTLLDEAENRNFVACFCEHPDILSMWRGYAGFGGGFCLVLDSTFLSATFPSFEFKHPLKITYGNGLSDPQKNVFQVALDYAHEGFYQAAASVSLFESLALKLKHPAFREEQEWRVVISNPSVEHMHFRAGHADVKAHVSLQPTFDDGSTKLPLQRIIIGPTLRCDNT